MFVNTTESINLVFRAEVTLILPRSVVKRYGYINLKVLPISRMRTFIRNTDFGFVFPVTSLLQVLSTEITVVEKHDSSTA